MLTLITGWDYLLAGLQHVGDDRPEPGKGNAEEPRIAPPAPRRAG